MTGSKDILFEKFEIIEYLKKDEHGGVYLANHIYLGKKIILKSLDTKIIRDTSIIERFKREAKILARLDHPNIIKVLDFGTYKDFFYISFEYFESLNLRQHLIKKNLAVEEKEKLARQLFRGLSYAHANNVVHRDIKPENILINKNYELKIGDFGLALSSRDNYVTSQYSVVGTPSYMSPEQVKGDKLTEQSDLFSAGIVILELFTGVNPFLGVDINESINNIINIDESIIDELIEDLPNQIRTLTEALLKRSPKKRLESADAALKILGDTDFSDKPGASDIKTRNKVLVYILPSLLLLIVIVAVIYLSDGESPDDINNKINEQMGGKIDTSAFKPEEENSVTNKNEPGELPNKSGAISDPEPATVITESRSLPGKLLIDCLPWAEVYIDSARIDITPVEMELPEGDYNVELVNPDYPSHKFGAIITADSITSFKFILDTLFGYLDCDAIPWGEIYIDSSLIGETPMRDLPKFIPGDYKLEIRNPQFVTYSRIIRISRNDTLVIRHNF